MLPIKKEWLNLAQLFDQKLALENVQDADVVNVSGRVEDYLRLLHEGAVYLKLFRGAYISAALRKREAEHGTRYGQGFMEDILREVQSTFGHTVAISTLYEERAVYDRVMINYNGKLTDLLDFMQKFKLVHGRVTWSNVRTCFTEDLPPEKLYGSKEAAGEIVARDVEMLARRIEHTAGSSIARDEQVESAMLAAGDSIRSLQSRASGLVGKEVTFNSPEYESWIRVQKCPITGAQNMPQGEKVVDLFHIWSGVEGAKESSLVTIPMNHKLHVEFHQIGIDAFAKKYGHVFGEEKINWYRLAMNYMHEYITGFAFDLEDGPSLRDNKPYGESHE